MHMGLDTKLVYTRYFTVSRATHVRMRKLVGVHNYRIYMRVHEKYACGTDMQLATSFSKTVNTGLSYVGR